VIFGWATQTVIRSRHRVINFAVCTDNLVVIHRPAGLESREYRVILGIEVPTNDEKTAEILELGHF
jgi:hypothetical protein